MAASAMPPCRCRALNSALMASITCATTASAAPLLPGSAVSRACLKTTHTRARWPSHSHFAAWLAFVPRSWDAMRRVTRTSLVTSTWRRSTSLRLAAFSLARSADSTLSMWTRRHTGGSPWGSTCNKSLPLERASARAAARGSTWWVPSSMTSLKVAAVMVSFTLRAFGSTAGASVSFGLGRLKCRMMAAAAEACSCLCAAGKAAAALGRLEWQLHPSVTRPSDKPAAPSGASWPPASAVTRRQARALKERRHIASVCVQQPRHPSGAAARAT